MHHLDHPNAGDEPRHPGTESMKRERKSKYDGKQVSNPVRQ
jgi:hypothetical protein